MSSNRRGACWRLGAAGVAVIASACVQRPGTVPTATVIAPEPAPAVMPVASSLPAGADDAAARLTASPRHSEWASIGTGADSVRAFVVFPERSTKAPVVIVVHEIFGLTPWVRAVADQLAADGFIAVAPDLLTGRIPAGLSDQQSADTARVIIRTLDAGWVQRTLDAVARYGTSLPAANGSYGIVGYCWGGSTSFEHAAHASALGASVVYYGSSPPAERLANVRAPVLGLYGEQDERVNSTIPRADSVLRAMGRTYEKEIYAGAGHGFLRQQTGMAGANMAATRLAWPRTVAFFRKHLER